MSTPNLERRLKVLWVASAAVFLVVIGTFFWPHQPTPPKLALDPALVNANAATLAKLNMRKQVDHPVSKEQQKTADGLASKDAPSFELPGVDGKTYTLAQLTEKKPLLIFFVEKNCPCCLGAKYYFDRMSDLYSNELNTVGIINADQAEAAKWVEETKATFPILKDPKLTVIKQFKAERGVYTTLVAQGGQIAVAYPGYGKEMLNELSVKIAELVKVKPRPYKALSAPERLTSGCKFPEPK